MAEPVNPHELQQVLDHPAFVTLTRTDLFHYLLCMTDPVGDAWAHQGTLAACIRKACDELPLEG